MGGSQTLAVGTITASVSAPPAGYTFALSSSDNKLAPVPASVKIAGGATTVSFTIKHKSTASVSKITLKAARAGVTATKTLTLNPFQIQSFQVSPSSQVGGKTVSGLISLNDSVGTGNGPISIKLASSSTNAVVPSTSSVSAGKSTSSVTITTKPVALNTVAKVTASLGISSAESAVTLQAPTLLSVSVKPASVKGSASTVVTGTISLNSSAPAAGLVVSLSSSNSSAVSVPVTVKIPGGKSSVTFSVGHKKVMTQTAVLITAGLAGVSQSATLTVTP